MACRSILRWRGLSCPFRGKVFLARVSKNMRRERGGLERYIPAIRSSLSFGTPGGESFQTHRTTVATTGAQTSAADTDTDISLPRCHLPMTIGPNGHP